MIESRLLRAFVLLAEELHFGRTAARMNIAQSALSGHVRRLEDLLGAQLLVRKARANVRLTRAGATFLEEARIALAQIERAERIGRLAARGAAGPVGIGYIFSAAMCGLLPIALAVAREQFSELVVSPVLMETPEQLTAVADARLDIGLVRPRPAYPERLAHHLVHRERLLLCLGATHWLANKKEVSVSDLANETFIIPRFNDQHGVIENHRRLAQAGGFSTRPIISTRDYVTAASMAAGGYGIVLAPVSLCNLRLEGVVYRPVQDYEENVDIILVHRAGEDLPLIEQIRSRLGAIN